MKSKTFFILLVTCAVLAGVSWFVLKPGTPSARKRTDTAGVRLLADLPVNDILRIDIAGPDSGVIMEKGEAVWVVKGKFGYPADFPKLTSLLLKLRDMKINRTFPASEDILDRLSLRTPDAPPKNASAKTGGTRITLKGRDGKPVADIIIGKARETDAGRGGNFVMPAGENTVYVVDQEFSFLESGAEDWIEKQILDIPPEMVAQVDRIDPKGKLPLYTVRRPAKAQPAEMTDAPKDKTVLPAKINRLMDALAAFQIEDVIDSATPAKKTGIGEGPCFAYTLFDGTVYTLCLGKTVEGNPDRTYLKATVGFTPPPNTGDEAATTQKAAPAETATDGNDKTTPTKDAPPEKTGDPARAAAERNEKISPWIFAVPKWKADQFISEKADFFEVPEPEKAED